METSPLFSQPAERVEHHYVGDTAPVENPVFSDCASSDTPPS